MKLAPFLGLGALYKARNDDKYSWLPFDPYHVLTSAPSPPLPHHHLTLTTVFELGIVPMFTYSDEEMVTRGIIVDS